MRLKFTRLAPVAVVTALCVAAAASAARGQSAVDSSTSASPDPYKPLRLYEGTWDAEARVGANPPTQTTLTDHCRQPGVFFVCEQVINGKSQSLIVFQPTDVTGPTMTYRTLGLSMAGEPAGAWGTLKITGTRWVYSSKGRLGGVVIYRRTINVFSDPDRIHFEVQQSVNDTTWETQRSGDERRVKQ